jgi:hypothetical protein
MAHSLMALQFFQLYHKKRKVHCVFVGSFFLRLRVAYYTMVVVTKEIQEVYFFNTVATQKLFTLFTHSKFHRRSTIQFCVLSAGSEFEIEAEIDKHCWNRSGNS